MGNWSEVAIFAAVWENIPLTAKGGDIGKGCYCVLLHWFTCSTGVRMKLFVFRCLVQMRVISVKMFIFDA